MKHRYREALKLYEEAYNIEITIIKEESLWIDGTLWRIAYLNYLLGNYRESIEVYQKYLSGTKMGIPDTSNYAGILGHLSLCYTATGNYAEAENGFIRCLEIEKKTNGVDSREYGLDLNRLAELYNAKKDYAKAEAEAAKAVIVNERFLPNHYRLLIDTYFQLAESRHGQEKFADSAEAAERVNNLIELSKDPPIHPKYVRFLKNHADTLRNLKRNEEASKAEALAAEVESALKQDPEAPGEVDPAPLNYLDPKFRFKKDNGNEQKSEPRYPSEDAPNNRY